MNRIMYCTLIIFLLIASGCSKEYSDADLVLLNVNEADLVMATPEESLFSTPKPNAYIDPRTAEKYTIGHIPGAINLP